MFSLWLQLKCKLQVAINVPIYRDSATEDPVVKEAATLAQGDSAAKPWHIYMDAMGFGMGLSCLQLTFQVFFCSFFLSFLSMSFLYISYLSFVVNFFPSFWLWSMLKENFQFRKNYLLSSGCPNTVQVWWYLSSWEPSICNCNCNYGLELKYDLKFGIHSSSIM